MDLDQITRPAIKAATSTPPAYSGRVSRVVEGGATYVVVPALSTDYEHGPAKLGVPGPLVEGLECLVAFDEERHPWVMAATALPATLPPSGPAGGDLQGSYPDPEVVPAGALHTIAGVSNINITSGQPVPGMSLTLPFMTGRRHVLMGFHAVYQNNSGVAQGPSFTFRRDGEQLVMIGGSYTANGLYTAIGGIFLDTFPEAGSHTYAPYWNGGGDGSGSTYLVGTGGYQTSFWVVEQ